MADNDRSWASRILRSFEEQVWEDVARMTHPALRTCESPIERLFGTALILCMAYNWGKPTSHSFLSEHAPQVRLQGQVEAAGFRVDFAIGWNYGSQRETTVAIECDGHDFHEKTKQQAARDKSRDRALSLEFAKVLRFTGSEIWRDPCACAMEAIGVADQVYWDFMLRGEQ